MNELTQFLETVLTRSCLDIRNRNICNKCLTIPDATCQILLYGFSNMGFGTDNYKLL